MASKTGPIRLRPLELGDLDALVLWRNDPYIREHLVGYRMPVTRSMEQEWLARAMQAGDREAHFAIETAPGKLIGVASLRAIDWVVRQARFGMMIGDAASRGRGYGRRVLDQILEFAFREINLERVYLEVADFNTPGVRLYKSAGFVQEGILRAHARRAGKPCDMLVFGLLRSEWRASAAAGARRRS